MATIVYAMMVALGEMSALFPVSGGFTHFAARFVDPALGFATGLNYFYSWAITIPVEIVAAQIVIAYWGESCVHKGDESGGGGSELAADV